MQALLASFIGEPYDWGGRYMAVYLAFPVVTTAAVALRWRRMSKTEVVALSTVLSASSYAFLHMLIYGVHSTMALGLMFALGVHSIFSVAAVIAVRAVQSLFKATSPPAASS